MKKLGAMIAVIFVAACSTGEPVTPTTPAENPPVSAPVETQASLPITDTPLAAPTDTPTAAPTAIGGGGGMIAFTSEQGDSSEIYIVNADGSDLHPLANEISPTSHPAWSSDGGKIAFGSNANNTASIYIANADGSDPVKLIDSTEINLYDPADPELRFPPGCCSITWSPDGTKIVFRITHYIGCCAMHTNSYLIDIDGRNLIHIAANKNYGDPVWSPDSQKIVFAGDCSELSVCVMNSDGTGLNSLTQDKKISGPDWSPNGKKIVFSTDWGGNSEIYVINADGSDLTRITYTVSPWDNNPVWSPDSQKIAFLSYRDGNYEIYTVNADGTDLANLTKSPEDDGGQVWSPDGTKIAFASSRDGSGGIFVIDSDGSNLTRLTNSNDYLYALAWSP